MQLTQTQLDRRPPQLSRKPLFCPCASLSPPARCVCPTKNPLVPPAADMVRHHLMRFRWSFVPLEHGGPITHSHSSCLMHANIQPFTPPFAFYRQNLPVIKLHRRAYIPLVPPREYDTISSRVPNSTQQTTHLNPHHLFMPGTY